MKKDYQKDDLTTFFPSVVQKYDPTNSERPMLIGWLLENVSKAKKKSRERESPRGICSAKKNNKHTLLGKQTPRNSTSGVV